MATSKKAKKAKITTYNIPQKTTNEQMEALLDFLELTPFQMAKLPLFFNTNGDSKNVLEYKIYLNGVMRQVHDENKFSGEYCSTNYINGLPNAISEAIEREYRSINLKEVPQIVLQKLGTCLQYCKCNFDDPGKIYEADFSIIGEIDDRAYFILMQEKEKLNVSVLKDIVKYFEPDYFVKYAKDYGFGDNIRLRSYQIMGKLINGEKIEDEEDEEDEEGLDEEIEVLSHEPINHRFIDHRFINLAGSDDEDWY